MNEFVLARHNSVVGFDLSLDSVSQSQGQLIFTVMYLVLTECIWHSPAVTTYLDIHGTVSGEVRSDRPLEKLIRACRSQAWIMLANGIAQKRIINQGTSITYLATNIQALGGKIACALSDVGCSPT